MVHEAVYKQLLYSETKELSAKIYHLSAAGFVNQLLALKTFFHLKSDKFLILDQTLFLQYNQSTNFQSIKSWIRRQSWTIQTWKFVQYIVW